MSFMQGQRVVLITGVAGGIGQATAVRFHESGWFVIGVDRKADQNLPGVDRYIQADAALPGEIRAALRVASQIAVGEGENGRLDALVNNAAIQVTKPMMEMSLEEWDDIMNVNVRSAFVFTQAAHDLLKASSGSIVNVSSVHAVATSADIAAYAASKGALLALTRALAVELAADDIRVNAILPGAVDTPMLRAGLNRGHVSGTVEEKIRALAAKTVIGRVGDTDEIARCILFLADNSQSSFMTGQALIVDGGATARLSTE
ncbi:MAG: SDR family oxidoreductase [Chloroflexota bacterium]